MKNVQLIFFVLGNFFALISGDSYGVYQEKPDNYQRFLVKNLDQPLDSSQTKWYEFLSGLYFKLSEYEIQKERSKYNVEDVSDWKSEGADQGISIVRNNFGLFLQKIAELNVTGYDDIKNTQATELKLKELNDVLKSTLNFAVRTSCEPSLFTVTGYFVRFADVKDMLAKIADKKFVDSKGVDCSTKLTEPDFQINIFVFHTVFIDEDISAKSSLFVLIAPRWEVIGMRKLSLDGENGRNATGKAINGYDKDDPNGRNGTNGEHGVPAGNFLGVGEQFSQNPTGDSGYRLDHLTITANGGDGGSGQEGGNGWNAGQAKNAEYNDLELKIGYLNETCKNADKYIGGFKCEFIYYTKTYEYSEFEQMEIRVFGLEALPGNAGSGGDGGNAGAAGKILLYELQEMTYWKNCSGIQIIDNPGRNGPGGKAGSEGMGENGYNLVVYIQGSNNQQTARISRHERGSSRFGQVGLNGKDGVKPDERIVESAPIINKYKSFLREILSGSFNL